MGVELPHPHEGDPLRLDLESGQRALQAGELALLIGQGIAVPLPLQAALSHQLHGVRVGVLVPLDPLDGNDHVLLQ